MPIFEKKTGLVLLLAVYAGCGGPPEPVVPAPPGTDDPATSTPASVPGASGGGSADAEGVTFKLQVPKPGATRTDHQSMSLEVHIVATRGEQTDRVTSTEGNVERKHVVSLASNAEGITKKKVTYVEMTKKKAQGPQSMTKKSPLTGKTYIIELKAGKTAFAREDGTKVSEVELEALREENKDFGKNNQLSKLLPNRPLLPGEVIPITPEDMRGIFGPGDGMTSVTLQFIDVEGTGADRVGKFKLGMTVDSVDNGLRTLIPLEGHITIRADTAWPVKMLLEGPVTIEGTDPEGTVFAGNGKMTIRGESTYGQE